MLDLELSEEQQLLKDSADRFVERDYGFDVRRKAAATEDGFRRETWKQMAELGWLSVGMPEDQGGFGGAKDIAVLMESMGRGLVAEPYLANVVLAGSAVALAGSDDQRRTLLEPMMAGDLLLALAYAEPRSRYDLAHVATRAEKSGDSWTLNGTKGLVINGDTADRLIVSARTSGDDKDRDGLSLFVVDAGADGASMRAYPTNDGGRAAEVTLDHVSVDGDALLGAEGSAFAALEETIDRAAAAVCAESLGLMAVLNDLTLDYSKTREQFGQAIGSFQALQHRMVDMFVALEESRSLTTVYMPDVESDDITERQLAVSAMKVQCDKAGRTVGQEAIQLHGGIAMTDDYMASHYFKRLSVIHRLFGDVDWHLSRYADLTA
ncbi:MAG: pimeloyl-CoA dehydrogenase small subunit [Rhodospirillaceae bacterium]|nr:pimeloyl-CoA dehydrogenase small subunit [Rhodospirillaceae bacterium]|tara:strand:- start:4610 stop:5746 length:1137 start_codon:yes stop_codon:yes gene_type:complete